MEGGRLWFGKTFTTARVDRVWAVSDISTLHRTYRLYSPREMQRWSVSADLVEAGCICWRLPAGRV